jgi:hypothetical protein
MKRTSFVGHMAILLAFVTSVPVQAQIAYSSLDFPRASPVNTEIIKENVSTPKYLNEINSKAMRHFLTNFAEVSNEKWYFTPQMTVAMFKLNGTDYRVDYDKKGEWIETYRTYDETKLSPDLRHAVNNLYPGYKIYLVQEIEQPPHPVVYVIHLEGKTKFIKLQVCNEVINEWQKFEKSK